MQPMQPMPRTAELSALVPNDSLSSLVLGHLLLEGDTSFTQTLELILFRCFLADSNQEVIPLFSLSLATLW